MASNCWKTPRNLYPGVYLWWLDQQATKDDRRLSTYPTYLVPEYPLAVSRKRSQQTRPSSRMFGCCISLLVHQIWGGLAGCTTKEVTTLSASTRPTTRIKNTVAKLPNQRRSTFYATLYACIPARRRAGAMDDMAISKQIRTQFDGNSTVKCNLNRAQGPVSGQIWRQSLRISSLAT